MGAIFTAIVRLIVGLFNAGTKTIHTATGAIDALDSNAQAYYSGVKAGAFAYSLNAESEAIERETARHVQVVADLEIEMRRNKDIFAEFEKQKSATMTKWEEHKAKTQKEDL